ncbi:MAG: UDP-N-acetylmuramoyl-tripeptide--D-alanyl-D-alanine ligase [Phycisphaerae bacterium]|nr:UDP-N-acetylmuramoyl-tripeptide--D-alanyl-D-alanine ligase [Phycisphaerae bacterium]
MNGVSIDSRTVQAGQAFFAIAGENFDGHDYAAAAIEKGASCIVVEREIDLPADCPVPVIQVDNCITALARFAAWYRQQLAAKVIAITGSVGKTTTRNILYQILSRFFKCRQAPKSFNNHIGVPLTLLSAEKEDEILFLELGSNHPGEIPYLAQIASPDIAVITHITHAHLEGFGTIENIIKEKSSIAQGLSAEGILMINGDTPELVDHVRTTYGVDMITVGTSRQCDIVGTDLKTFGPHGSLVIEGRTVSVPLAGKANLLNVLFAWGVCREFIPLSDFIEAVEFLQPYERRLVPVSIGPLVVLDDCYNANPASMDNALCCLRSIAKESGRRSVFVAGCMAELGHESVPLHEKLGRNATCQEVQVLLCAGPFSKQIVQGAQKTAKYPLESQAFENTDQLCDNLHKWVHPDDIILVKGSRSASLEKAVQRLRVLFGNQ